jgi:hypothetical protein
VNERSVLAALCPPLWPGYLQAFGFDQYWPRCARHLAQINISLFWVSGVQNNPKGPVYMRGGTGRLPGRDDARDPGMHMFL